MTFQSDYVRGLMLFVCFLTRYFFMLHLSLADFLVAIFNILPQLAWDITYRFRGGDLLCRFVKYTQIMTLYLSTFILMFMAVDRYRAVCISTNLHWKSLKVAKGMVLCSWLMALLFALPQAIIFHEEEIQPGVHDCWVRFIEPWGAKAYVTWFVISIFGAPLLVIVVCYGVISRQIWIYSQSALVLPDVPPRTAAPSTPVSGSKWAEARRWVIRARIRWKRSRSSAAKTSASANPSIADITTSSESTKSLRTTNQITTFQLTTPHPGHSPQLPPPPLPPPPVPQCCAHRPFPLRRSNSNRISKAKMKTIKLTSAVVICFVACWAPFCITQLVMVYNPPTDRKFYFNHPFLNRNLQIYDTRPISHFALRCFLNTAVPWRCLANSSHSWHRLISRFPHAVLLN